jgi:hypothetical protein
LVYGRVIYVSAGIGAMNNTWKSTDATGGSHKYNNFISSIGAGINFSNKHRFTIGYKQVFVFPMRWNSPVFYIENAFSFN